MNDNDTEAAKSRIKNQTSGLSVSLIGRHYYFFTKTDSDYLFSTPIKEIQLQADLLLTGKLSFGSHFKLP